MNDVGILRTGVLKLLVLTIAGAFCAGCETAPVQESRSGRDAAIFSARKGDHDRQANAENCGGSRSHSRIYGRDGDALSGEGMRSHSINFSVGDEIRADVVVTDGKPVLEKYYRYTKKGSGTAAPLGAAELMPQPGRMCQTFNW